MIFPFPQGLNPLDTRVLMHMLFTGYGVMRANGIGPQWASMEAVAVPRRMPQTKLEGVSEMDNKGTALANVQRKIEILRSTIERRFPPDETIDAALDDLDCEVALLRRKLKEN